MIDRELLERTAGGDERALAELYRRHGPLCRTRAFRVLRDHALAEDAVQEAFLDLWRTAAGFDPDRAAVATWLCVLVHRRAVDIARREARRRHADELLPALDPASYTAEETLLLLLDRRRVRSALIELSPAHRQVVELAFYGGLTHSELARRLCVPLGTVKSRMTAALGRLAVVLAAG
ncbi:MAG TPA: sigma-70 family RNA polymerase sigma factor [Gaiellaceae bacterium]|nr:sigma-70 family RNA polymerase sigma factor [Gaiellaceae bacterium]